MRTRTALRAGLAFGVAAVVGGSLAVAFDGAPGVGTDAAFSDEPLAIFGDEEALVPDAGTLGLGEPIIEHIDGAPIYRAASAAGITAYVTKLADQSICVIAAAEAADVTMTCGTSEMAAAGRVVLRTQDRPTDPSYFVGVMPNDATGAEVDGRSAVVGENAFIAVGTATSGAYAITGDDGQRVDVDMHIDQVPDGGQAAD